MRQKTDPVYNLFWIPVLPAWIFGIALMVYGKTVLGTAIAMGFPVVVFLLIFAGQEIRTAILKNRKK